MSEDLYMGDIRYPGKDEHRAVVLMLATEDGTGIDSWRWYFERSTTSFYIKSMRLLAPQKSSERQGHFPMCAENCWVRSGRCL